MKKCNEGCHVICDFCLHFEHERDDDGDLTGGGYCVFHEKTVSFTYGCDDYHCFRLAKEAD
jgi:hypothetical protein